MATILQIRCELHERPRFQSQSSTRRARLARRLRVFHLASSRRPTTGSHSFVTTWPPANTYWS
eukprot:5584404-Prymnesium_polylepis.1